MVILGGLNHYKVLNSETGVKMSLELNTKPVSIIQSATIGGKAIIMFNGIEMDLDTFCHMVNYIMCNTPLGPQDPRLALLEDMRCLYKREYNGTLCLTGSRPLPEYYSIWSET